MVNKAEGKYKINNGLKQKISIRYTTILNRSGWK